MTIFSNCPTRLVFVLVSLLSAAMARGQSVQLEVVDGKVITISDGTHTFPIQRPLVAFMLGDKQHDSAAPSPMSISATKNDNQLTIRFTNASKDTARLHNVVPFAPGTEDVHITGKGTHRLSRTHLFLPARQPVNVIVPDNAWDLGYTSLRLSSDVNLFGLTRRNDASVSKGTLKRFEAILAPGGSVEYRMHAETYTGDWQEGLRQCFQARKLFDLEKFDNTLYNREDLQWIRKAYVMHLMMAWDKDYYDYTTGKFNWNRFVARGKKLYGGDDVICLWPTWPTLGLDPRNQFDMYRDLPGGLPLLRQLADTLRAHHTRFFIAYNPWDESTRSEGHLQGLSDLIRQTSADGVVLDTKGESSLELQHAADEVRLGVIMYSEGMAVPRDMPGIVSGRVHNALYYPPMLNLNKFIKPDFAIFRVAEVYKEPIRREYAVAFFNGYGTEINQFAPGHPEWEEEQYRFLGRTSRILRENSASFLSPLFIPLLPTKHDSIWVNYWPAANKKIYTLFSLKPEGFKDALFEVIPRQGHHWVDLWNHKPVALHLMNGRTWAEATLEGFNKSELGTNNEGQAGCIAELPEALKLSLSGNELRISARVGDVIRIWPGLPSYEKTPLQIAPGEHMINIMEKFGPYEGPIVVQLFDDEELIDENFVTIRSGSARKISKAEKTSSGLSATGMVKIPSGKFRFKTTHGDAFIPYPDEGEGQEVDMPEFWMDKFPVTNDQFKRFLDATGYKPSDTSNFLKHWRKGTIPKGMENYPVVYVSYEDAVAYGRWAGKRLPTELEWQYAAQTSKGNEWPWKQEKPVVRKEQYVTETLTVKSLEGIDPRHCNLGDGKPYPVGKYPRGQNPFGLQDLVGSVWQLTHDIYESGSYRYIMMKGGSYFKPSSSWWYVQGGPRELHYRQALLRVSPGFERNATVGFRCAGD